MKFMKSTNNMRFLGNQLQTKSALDGVWMQSYQRASEGKTIRILKKQQ